MRTFFRLVIVVSLAGSVALTPSFGLGTIGHGRLVGNASVRVDYDSNIFISNTQIDDYVTTFDGAVRYVRDSGILTFEAAIGTSVTAFLDNNDENTIDPFTEARFGYSPSDKTTMRGNVVFKRSSIANEQVNDRTQSNDFLLDGSFEHLTTEKLGLRVLGNYAQSAYHTAGYSDVLSYGLGAHVVHHYSPKLKLLAGVTMLEWWTKDRAPGRRSPSSNDVRYSVGAEGELAPKITGDFNVGFVQREFDSTGFGDTSALYLSSRIGWAASEKTTLSLVLSQNLSVSAADQSVKMLSGSVNLRQSFTEKLNFEGSAGVDRATYVSFNNIGNRKDDGYVVRGRLNYLFTDSVAVDLSTGYRDNDSNLATSTYDRFNIGAGLSVRF
jgi:polysaccharide biosynthesis protein VpsM